MISRISAVFAVVLIVGAFVYPGAYCYPETGASRESKANSGLADKYIRTELYFGFSRKGREDVTEEEFQAFVDDIVTPRFPEGLTFLEGRGQWRESDRTITNERSKVLILVYPKRDKRSASRKIDEIREEYKKRFAQSSVLRIDMNKSLSVSF